MSSFPQHVDNIERLKELDIDVDDCYEGDEVTLESWGYDEQTYLMDEVILEIYRLQHIIRRLKGEE